MEARGAAVHREVGSLRRELNNPDPDLFQKNGDRIPCSKFWIIEWTEESG